MKNKRRSPRTTIVLEGWRDGHLYTVTEYSGSSLKAGTAFMQALQKAQEDKTVEKVYYFERQLRPTAEGGLESVNNQQVIVPVREAER